MTTVDVQVRQSGGGRWYWGIPGVYEEIAMPDGRVVFGSQAEATAAAAAWLAHVAEMVRAGWPMVGVEMEAGEAKIIEAVAVWSGLPNKVVEALMEQARWFAEDEVTSEVDAVSPYVDADGDAPFVALTAWCAAMLDYPEVTWERWVLVGEQVGDVVSLEEETGGPPTTLIGMASGGGAKVRAPIAEVAVALGLRARDCRNVGAPAEEE